LLITEPHVGMDGSGGGLGPFDFEDAEELLLLTLILLIITKIFKRRNIINIDIDLHF
jgi:hypothetical protein